MSSTLVQIQMILDTDLHVGQDDSTGYMDSMVVCPLNKKKKSKSDMIGEVPAVPGPCWSAGGGQGLQSHIYTTVWKSVSRWTLQVHMIARDPSRSSTQLRTTATPAGGQPHGWFYSHNTSSEPSVAAF